MDTNDKATKDKKNVRKTAFGIKLPPIEPCESEEGIKTTINIDPAFFSMIDGRPIRPNTSIAKYKQNIKDVALKRTQNGYVNDEILRINREMESERIIYENAARHFEDYQNSFDKFLADDNNNTIAIMKKSDHLAKDLVNLTEDQKQVNYEMASIKSKLQYIDETLMILLAFEKFLHKASPILWQEQNNIQLEVNHSEFITMSNDVFQQLDVAGINEKLNGLPRPRLYFETPDQLLKIFELLEKQNLNYLLVTEEVNLQKNNFLKAVHMLKEKLQEELSYIQQKIQETENIINWNEIRESELKEIFFKILKEKMEYLITSEMALQIYNYIEYAYEQFIADNDTGLSPLEMMQTLELEYNNIMLDLSVFDLEDLKKIENETYENEAKQIVRAKDANKLLKDVEKLSKRLKSSYEPSRKKAD